MKRADFQKHIWWSLQTNQCGWESLLTSMKAPSALCHPPDNPASVSLLLSRWRSWVHTAMTLDTWLSHRDTVPSPGTQAHYKARRWGFVTERAVCYSTSTASVLPFFFSKAFSPSFIVQTVCTLMPMPHVTLQSVLLTTTWSCTFSMLAQLRWRWRIAKRSGIRSITLGNLLELNENTCLKLYLFCWVDGNSWQRNAIAL